MSKTATLPIYADECRVDMLQRLTKVQGQVRGVARMVDEQRPCAEVLQQLASVQGALRRVTQSVLRNYLEKCATDAIKSGEPGIYDDLMEAIYKFVK